MNRKTVLSLVREVKETSDAKETAQLLSTGKWVAIYAAQNGDVITSVLGRID